MTLRLDRSRPFGTISPPWSGDNDELPRPAAYEQDGRLFDAHDGEIVLGKQPKKKAAPPPPPPVEDEIDEDDDERDEAEAVPQAAAPEPEEEPEPIAAPMSPRELLERADRIAFSKFVMEAKRILGPTCPKGKEAIKIALQEAIAAFEARQAKRGGMSWGSVTAGKPKGPPPAPPAPAPAPAGNGRQAGVDLAAWARGRQEYIFADITKAIRTTYGRQIGGEHARKDAVDFLIGERVITAAEARKDV